MSGHEGGQGAAIDYRLLDLDSLQPLDLVELHVLARAYRDAWRLLNASEPLHDHVIPSLNLLIHYAPDRAGRT